MPSLNQGDGIHPNIEGAQIVADTVWNVLRPALDQIVRVMIELRGVSQARAERQRHAHDPASARSRDPVGPRRRDHRSVRQRQVDAARAARRARLAVGPGASCIDGVDITALDEDALARLRGKRIGFVFQFFHLLPSLTALENVLVPMEIAGAARRARARADALLAEVGLADRGHHYPSQLSGGEQQRVAIARALANDPPLLLADEPTGNLDSQTGHQVIELLLDVNRTRSTTLVLVTHDPELARAGRRDDRAARRPRRRAIDRASGAAEQAAAV